MTKETSGNNLEASFLEFSGVRHALLVTNQVKHFTLVGVLPFHIWLHGPRIPPEWVTSYTFCGFLAADSAVSNVESVPKNSVVILLGLWLFHWKNGILGTAVYAAFSIIESSNVNFLRELCNLVLLLIVTQGRVHRIYENDNSFVYWFIDIGKLMWLYEGYCFTD